MRRRFVEARWDQAPSLRLSLCSFYPRFSAPDAPFLSLSPSLPLHSRVCLCVCVCICIVLSSRVLPAPLHLYSLSARLCRWSRGASCASQVLPVRCIRRIRTHTIDLVFFFLVAEIARLERSLSYRFAFGNVCLIVLKFDTCSNLCSFVLYRSFFVFLYTIMQVSMSTHSCSCAGKSFDVLSRVDQCCFWYYRKFWD